MEVNRKTVIVLLPTYDSSQQVFFSQSDRYNVKTLTAKDLSSSGWYYDDSDEKNSRCVIGSEILVENDIDGVITRLPTITEDQLPHIIADDRAYLASEMTAFLLAWLSSLSCPMLNRPTANCLSGPYRRPEQWAHCASKMGLPVVEHVQSVNHGARNISSPSEGPATVVVIGDRYVGDVHPRLASCAGKIARASGVDFLAVDFTHQGQDARFIGAGLWPPVTNRMAGLMLDFVTDKRIVATIGRELRGA
jgi:hypothetical protein